MGEKSYFPLGDGSMTRTTRTAVSGAQLKSYIGWRCCHIFVVLGLQHFYPCSSSRSCWKWHIDTSCAEVLKRTKEITHFLVKKRSHQGQHPPITGQGTQVTNPSTSKWHIPRHRYDPVTPLMRHLRLMHHPSPTDQHGGGEWLGLCGQISRYVIGPLKLHTCKQVRVVSVKAEHHPPSCNNVTSIMGGGAWLLSTRPKRDEHKKKVERKWMAEWGKPIYFSHGETNSRGVIILINWSKNFRLLNLERDKDGCLLFLHVMLDGHTFVLAN